MQQPRYYQVDHRHLFIFGFVFYLLTPVIAGKMQLFDGYPGIALFQRFFSNIPASKIKSYVVITLSWLPAFFLGHALFSIFKPYKFSLIKFASTLTSRNISYISLGLLIALALFAYLGRGSILGGYSSYDVAARGKISTLLVLFNFFLIYSLLTKQGIPVLLIAGTGLTSLLLLSMGGRMYVFQTITLLLMYKTSFAARRWKFYHLIILMIAAFFISGALGVWRMGATLNLPRALYSFFAEPVFTWISTASYLANNHIPVVNFPENFLSSFINVVPNTFLNLRQFVVPTTAMSSGYESPLGADSIWTNLVINFGWVGSFFFVMLTGFVLNFLRHLSESGRFAACFYFMVCSLLPFQFFRDGFFILNKQLFFNFLFLPALSLLFLKFVLYASVGRRNALVTNPG